MNDSSIKHNSIVESYINCKPLIDLLKKNLSKLSDFVISIEEIKEKVPEFEYNSFLKVFESVSEFSNLNFLKNPYSDGIFHVVAKGKENEAFENWRYKELYKEKCPKWKWVWNNGWV